MPAEKRKKEKKDTKLADIVILVDSHIHAGEPAEKGVKIGVCPETKEMLEKAWDAADKKCDPQ